MLRLTHAKRLSLLVPTTTHRVRAMRSGPGSRSCAATAPFWPAGLRQCHCLDQTITDCMAVRPFFYLISKRSNPHILGKFGSFVCVPF